jgi:hypothetical protein
MPKAHRTKRQGVEAAARAALSQLAKKGAFAAPMDATSGAGAAFGVFRSSDTSSPPTTLLGADTILHLCHRKWLAADAQTGHYRLTPAGVGELRRSKSAPAGSGSAVPHPAARARTSVRVGKGRQAAQPLAQESPLVWLRRRKDKDGQPLITEPQFNAGERLAADFWHAQMTPRVTANWSAAAAGRHMRRSAPGAGVDLKDNVVAARTRVHRALAAVGPELAGILVDVCCHDVGLEPAGQSQGWPQRAAKVVLQLALTRLARHYGLLAPQPPPGAARLRHWGDEDYRPSLDAWRG